jgi:hypothetical protein
MMIKRILFFLFVICLSTFAYAGPLQRAHLAVIGRSSVAAGSGPLVGQFGGTYTFAENWPNDQIRYYPGYTAVASGTATEICFLPHSVDTVTLTLYDSGKNLLGYATLSATDLSGAAQCGTLNQPVSITNGQTYYLGPWAGDYYQLYAIDGATPAMDYDTETYTGTPPATLSDDGNSNQNEVAIWVQ